MNVLLDCISPRAPTVFSFVDENRRPLPHFQMSISLSTRRRQDLIEAEREMKMMAKTTTFREERGNSELAFLEAFGLSYLSTRRRGNYMHHRGKNERKDRTFGFYELPCVVNMRRRYTSIYDIVFVDSEALHSTAGQFLTIWGGMERR